MTQQQPGQWGPPPHGPPPGSWQWQPPPPPVPRRGLLNSYPVRLLGAVAIIAGIVAAARLGVIDDNDSQRASSSSSARASESAPQSRPVVADGIGPGVWLVGTDVQPGTYRSAGAATADDYCMWSRHDSAAGGPFDGIIASDGQFGPGQMIVTVDAGDVLFRTSGCAPFTKIG